MVMVMVMVRVRVRVRFRGRGRGRVARLRTRRLAVRPLHAAHEVAEVREALGREVAPREQLGARARG